MIRIVEALASPRTGLAYGSFGYEPFRLLESTPEGPKSVLMIDATFPRRTVTTKMM
jgi:hypothetical protein